MRKFLAILSLLLCVVYTGFAELEVEWIDPNTIRVYGYGYAPGETVVVTNWLGCCTNCTLITPAELTSGMNDIISRCDSISSISGDIVSLADQLNLLSVQGRDDISTFRRFGVFPSGPTGAYSQYFHDFTNYVYSVENTQTSLDKTHIPDTVNNSLVKVSWMSYNNGIYDYANSSVLYLFDSVEYLTRSVVDSASSASYTADDIKYIAERYISLSECPCGDSGSGGGGDGGGCAWTAEQIRELLGYVDHIDRDQHERYTQLHDMSNRVYNIDKSLDSYAKLVSGVLYQDATIVVDDGENSWSNVYNTGHSQLYDYDKSNILQRIELLLYGLVSNTSTNWGSATSDVSGDVEDLQDTIDDVKSSVDSANIEYTSEVNTIWQKITSLFNSLNFFGAGSLGNFSYGEPMQFDVYDFQFDFTNAADFRPLQQVCRTALQIFYWTAGVVFMLVFWYRVVKFTTDFVLRIIHFFNNLLT